MYSGDTNQSAVLYDSLQTESVPFEGVISEGAVIRIDFLGGEPAGITAFNIRFEGDAFGFGAGQRDMARAPVLTTPLPSCISQGFSSCKGCCHLIASNNHCTPLPHPGAI